MTNNQAKKLYQKGIELLTYGKPQEAMNYFREAVDADPFCMEAQLELGYILGTMESYEEALKSFNNALKIQNSFPGLFGQGLSLFLLEDYEKSLESFLEALEIGENEDVWYYKGDCHLILGDYENAVNSFEISLSMDPDF
ncbi:MAG: tetratricopeptide repeat protein, partial [Methanobacteriaceae archaeon]|nr:tetratricopeptide repeat protein [Methanobacteriaceae archaeon]